MALIGPHGQNYSEAVKAWARSAPIVKLMIDPGIFNDAPNSAIRIFRPWTGDNNRNVAEVLKAVDDQLKGYRHPNLYVEPLNEPLPWENAATMMFFQAIVPALNAKGLKVAGPSWSVGNPEQDVFNAWMAAGFCGISLVTFHAYWAERGFTPWAAMRPLRLIREAGFMGNWAITEGGRDNLSTPAFGEGGKGGWVKDGVSPEQYVAELMDFTAQNSAHPGFMGFTPFTGGPAEEWKSYTTDPLVPKILAYSPQPQPPQPQPEPPPVSNDAIATKYNLLVTETPTIGVRFEDVTNGTVELEALGPSDLMVTLMTADGQNRAEGMGRAAIIMAASSKYFPSQGRGPWVAVCAGARVDGLGMMPDHSHPRTIFYRKATPPPEPPPVGGLAWRGAFLDYAASHPEVGQPIGEIAYHPEPGAWVTAGQVSKTHLLTWNGLRVVAIPRDK